MIDKNVIYYFNFAYEAINPDLYLKIEGSK